MSEAKLLVKDKDIVVPGEVLAQGMDYLPGAGSYRLGDDILANRLGLLMLEGKVLKTVPLSGRYLPKRYDVVIGKVIDILMSGWRLDINSAYPAVLPLKDASFSYIPKGEDLTKYFELDDYVVLKITNVTSQNLVDVTCKGPGLHKLKGGRIIYVNTHKVPRIIGKKGSMVSLIKKATDCKIIVGQNGIAWLSGEPEMEVIAVNAVNLIEENSHISGLTEKIKEHLEKVTGRKLEIPTEAELEQESMSEEHREERPREERRYERRPYERRPYERRGERRFERRDRGRY
ncbi:MAG TPA: exosome complex RNA-binding protein Rrp4 [Candidatus Nanoarchaeia archaeon]|nr:exosome complex RNA-binding protein Rrp4 [Candidatus Nanoarchaeia archaeon]